MKELTQEYELNFMVGVFCFDSRDESNLRLSVSGEHPFAVSEDEQKIQECINEIFKAFPPLDKYGFKKGQYRYRNSEKRINHIAIKILQKNGIEIIND